MADNNNNNQSSSSKDKGKDREDAGVASGPRGGQRHPVRRGGFQSSHSSSRRPANRGNSSSAPTTMFHGATHLPKGDLKLETTESTLGVTSYGYVDKKGGKPKSVVANLDIPGCLLAMGGVDESTKALLEAWRLFREARPGKQISWMLFVDETPDVVQTPARGSKRGRDDLAGTHDSEARPAKALKLPAPEQPAGPAKAPKAPAPKQPTRPEKAGDPQPSGQFLSRAPTEHKCVGCGSKGHTLRRCLKAGQDGIMKGCPRCNSLTHSVLTCTVMDDKEKLHFSVTMRRGMPPFVSIKSWAELVRETPSKASTLPGFPWSEEFTKSLAEEIPRLQEALDKYGFKSPSGFTMPQDPLTKDWAAVESILCQPFPGAGTATPGQIEAALAQVAEIFKKIKDNEPDTEMANTSEAQVSEGDKRKSALDTGDVDQTQIKEEETESGFGLVALFKEAESGDALTSRMNALGITKEQQPDGREAWRIPEEDSDEDDAAFMAAATHYDSLE